MSKVEFWSQGGNVCLQTKAYEVKNRTKIGKTRHCFWQVKGNEK
jgi:hypothetical protein